MVDALTSRADILRSREESGVGSGLGTADWRPVSRGGSLIEGSGEGDRGMQPMICSASALEVSSVSWAFRRLVERCTF